MVLVEAIMGGPTGMSSFVECKGRVQAYFLARRVGNNFFPEMGTVMWPSPTQGYGKNRKTQRILEEVSPATEQANEGNQE
jgi:hypothetical protein